MRNSRSAGPAQVNLLNYIRLWDLLATNGVPMCGASTSDQHGAPFVGPAFWTTWIEADSPTRMTLLASMRRCRLFFGNLGALRRRLWTCGWNGVPMGGVSSGAEEGAVPAAVSSSIRLPAGAEVKLVQDPRRRRGVRLT